MTQLAKRRISIGLAFLVLVGGALAASQIASQKEPPPKRERATSVREVRVRAVQPEAINVDIPLQGRLVAFQTIPLFAEVTGVFEESSKPFKQGVFFRKGDLLARIDDTEPRYQLLAQKSQLANALAQAMPELKIDYTATFPAWDAYLRAFDPERPLPELPPVADDAARFFLNAKGIYERYYTIKAAEERLRKHTLTAPVSGTLTEAQANVGALIRAGQPLGTLTANAYELAATVPVADLDYLRPGTRATLDGPSGETYAARVNRVSTQIDPNTQSATVFLDVSGKGLREGLYLRGSAGGAALDDVVPVDQRYLVGEDEVYVLRDSTLQRTSVEVVRRGEERVFVRGLETGTQLLDEALPGAYSGMRVNPRS